MATPNNAPNPDGATHSIIKLLWRNRNARLRRDQKPRKDVWDIIDIMARGLIALLTVVAAIVIPIVVAKISEQVQKVVTAQITGKDYIQIALGILQSHGPELEKKATFSEKQRNRDLRSWAVSLINKTSPIALPQRTADELINGETEIPYFTTLPLKKAQSDWEENAFQTFLEDAVHATSPSGNLRGFATKDGTVFVTPSSSVVPMRVCAVGVTSPNGLLFSPDEWNLVAFNDHKLAIVASEGHTSQGLPVYNDAIRVSPAIGIFKIAFSDDSKTIIVTGTDNKEIRYELDGNEVK
jgi:hypothetical protein